MKRVITILAVTHLACGGVNESEPTTEPKAVSQNEEAADDTGTEPADRDVVGDRADDEVPTERGLVDGALRLTDFHPDVFVAQGCTSGYCHASFQLASAEAVVAAFVDVEAAKPTCGRTHYVVPGDPEQSILWVRVRPITDEDRECEVVKMPASSAEGLDAETAQLVYDWIADGAHL